MNTRELLNKVDKVLIEKLHLGAAEDVHELVKARGMLLQQAPILQEGEERYHEKCYGRYSEEEGKLEPGIEVYIKATVEKCDEDGSAYRLSFIDYLGDTLWTWVKEDRIVRV